MNDDLLEIIMGIPAGKGEYLFQRRRSPEGLQQDVAERIEGSRDQGLQVPRSEAYEREPSCDERGFSTSGAETSWSFIAVNDGSLHAPERAVHEERNPETERVD